MAHGFRTSPSWLTGEKGKVTKRKEIYPYGISSDPLLLELLVLVRGDCF
jgi:hypothetical protein